jgi:hypothetical protein
MGTFTQNTISVDKLIGDIKRIEAELRAVASLPPEPEIIVSDAAMQDTDERLFPVSKNRSKRIHKKLLKRFGGEFRKKPAVFRLGNRWIMHPELWHQMKLSTATRLHQAREDAFYGAYAGIRVHGVT